MANEVAAWDETGSVSGQDDDDAFGAGAPGAPIRALPDDPAPVDAPVTEAAPAAAEMGGDEDSGLDGGPLAETTQPASPGADDPGLSDLWRWADGDPVRLAQTPPPHAQATADEVSPDQILRDRPDVMQAFYSEYWGPNNDRHSHAWVDRVGGDTPQDYARYWYEHMGGKDSYQPGAAAEAAEGAQAAAGGRTTIDGIPLDQILRDRPDVFQAFFTEYYGPNNDRHSSAWDDRVGGHTPEDYANYWYNTGGKLGGYIPSTAAHDPPAAAEPPPEAPADDAQAAGDDPLLQVGQPLTGADPLTGD